MARHDPNHHSVLLQLHMTLHWTWGFISHLSATPFQLAGYSHEKEDEAELLGVCCALMNVYFNRNNVKYDNLIRN